MTQELVDEFKQALGVMSYYNAAEGSWREEAVERRACQEELKRLARNLMFLGINPRDIVESTTCLVSESDYK